MLLEERLTTAIKKRKENKNYRQLRQERNSVDFTSNDYLGLARNKDLEQRIHQASEGFNNGSGGSRLLSGNSDLAEETEEYLAHLFEAQGSLIFNSGYMANLALFSALPQRGDTVIYDELSHACIKDGIRLSSASKYSFKHNDLGDLVHKIKRAKGNVFVAVESIYSMDGDQCPMAELLELVKPYNARVIVDEAHATGVLGKTGGGLSMHEALHQDIFARVYTFGKAMGIHGAAVVGSQLLKDYLINFARPFIYNTAPPPHSFIAIREAFRYLVEHIFLQDQARDRVHYFKTGFKRVEHKFECTKNAHPIQAVIIPGNERVVNVSEKLNLQGFDIRPILSPTIKEGSERIRICLHTFNTHDEISSLIDSLAVL